MAAGGGGGATAWRQGGWDSIGRLRDLRTRSFFALAPSQSSAALPEGGPSSTRPIGTGPEAPRGSDSRSGWRCPALSPPPCGEGAGGGTVFLPLPSGEKTTPPFPVVGVKRVRWLAPLPPTPTFPRKGGGDRIEIYATR